MTSILRTVQQTETPLSMAFFSDLNMRRIQNAIRQTFKDKTGISIDYQNPRDVLVLMRASYINNSRDPWSQDVASQVQIMNDAVVQTAVGQIGTGVNQYIDYIRDITSPPRLNDLPISTTTYGKSLRAQTFWR